MNTLYEQLHSEPRQHEIETLPNGAKFLEINQLEDALDEVFDSWGTQNFSYYLYRNGYANLCVAASIELWVEKDDKRRTIVGSCNFSIKAIHPNPHFMATAKSECVKNAASDLGKRFGRGLNKFLEVIPNEESEKEADEGVTFVENLSNVKFKPNAPKV